MEHVCHWKPPVPHDCNDFISKPQPQTESGQFASDGYRDTDLSSD